MFHAAILLVTEYVYQILVQQRKNVDSMKIIKKYATLW